MKNKIKICIALICVLALLPIQAFAFTIPKTHSWKTTINANISTDGTIQVSEQRIVDVTKFIEKAKGNNQGSSINLEPYVWSFNSFPDESNVVYNGAKIALINNEDAVIGNWAPIPASTYLKKWDQSAPTSACCAYDAERKHLCMFNEFASADNISSTQASTLISSMTGLKDPNTWTMNKIIINIDYSIKNAPVVYKDVADFNWTYVSDTWRDDSYHVSLNVSIPVGNESIASPLGKVSSVSNTTTERNIYAWGHGSSTGIVNLNPSGSVTVTNDIVPGETDAELRIVFPSAWLKNISNTANVSHANQTKLTSILKDESVWHDSRQKEVNKLIVPLCVIGACIILMSITFIELIRYKRKFKTQAVSNTKVQDLNPCLIVRLKNWNHEHAYDIVASVLHLNDLGKLWIKKMHSGDFSIELKNKNFAKNPYKARSLDSIDKRTINFLFGVCATKHFKTTLADLFNFASTRSNDFILAYLTWHSQLTDEVNGLNNFKSTNDRIRHVLFALSGGMAFISIILGIYFMDWITPLVGIFTAIISTFIANTLRNKIYFKDSKEHVINAVDIPIGLKEYNKTIAEFKDKFAEVLHEAVLIAQDKML